MLQYGRNTALENVRKVGKVGRLPCSDELALGYELGEQRRGRELLPVGEALLAEKSQDAAVADEDAAIRITERARLDAGSLDFLVSQRILTRNSQLTL
jgi:hypothetical protein